MSGDLEGLADGADPLPKHPLVNSIEDVITFKLQSLVAMGDRLGHQRSEGLSNLSQNECRLLALITSRGESRAGDLADALLMDKSQTSRLIKSLLSKGFIQNLPDPRDGRAISLSPTQEGTMVQNRILVGILASNEWMLSPLTQREVLAFDATLKKLVAHSQDTLERQLGKALER